MDWRKRVGCAQWSGNVPGQGEPGEAGRAEANCEAERKERPPGGEAGGQSQEAPVNTRDASRQERGAGGPGTTAGRSGRGRGRGCFAAVSVVLRWVGGLRLAHGTRHLGMEAQALPLLPLFMTSLHTQAPASLDSHDPKPNVKVTSSREPSWIEPGWSTYHMYTCQPVPTPPTL